MLRNLNLNLRPKYSKATPEIFEPLYVLIGFANFVNRSIFLKLIGNSVIYRSVVGARLGHGWGKNSNNVGQGRGKVGAWLGHGTW